MDMTVKKRSTLPIRVQLSLTFGRFPDRIIRKEATAGNKIAKSGLNLIDSNSIMA